jgi:hypothetical protein
MLPAWATVAIALGGSAITAVLAFTGALVTSRRQDVAQWRTVVLAAADDFSTGVGQALRALREAIAAFEERELEFRPTEGESVEAGARELAPDGPQARGLWLCAEAVAAADDRLARVRLLFGHNSTAGLAAGASVERLHEANTAVHAYAEQVEAEGGLPESPEALVRAKAARALGTETHADFNEAAREAIPGRPRHWPGLGRT